jgi:ABC-type Zn uptake system ZnuABC Zn-binding protein ZnuA
MRPERLLVLALIATSLAACGSAPRRDAQALQVLAAESWLADIAQNVAGERLAVEALLPAGVDPHSFELRPQDAIRIAESDLLIINGVGYEPWLATTLPQEHDPQLLVSASDGLRPLPDATGEHPQGDPHLWMNPRNVVQYVENIRDRLSWADPAGAETYAANAAAYTTELEDLDRWIQAEVGHLAPQQRLMVTNHDALGYFAETYGFRIVGAVIPSLTTEASPSAQQMAGLIQSIKGSGARVIFLDASENEDLARQIAAETGAKVVTGLYVETLSDANGPAKTYIEMIKHDVSVIVNALQ